MPVSVLIRLETSSDILPISRIVEAAFCGHPHSDGREPEIVNHLRADGALTISLVAESEREVVGHVAISPVTIAPSVSAWYALGPVSVHPIHQSRGIGSALVLRGLSELEVLGAAGCVVYGNPVFYGRFGFKSYRSLLYPHGAKEFFLAKVFGDKVPEGTVTYSVAFNAA
ncbi:hypothetical protein VZ94_15910 [Methylocucumis oryzae]|uniref:N-acetyltransferase domain-containing protein n=1 Tax=Methylocucumis oryzae TaxID=1632867 RepID=A0A0F3IGC6_9GAMM|nr:hypothetical protein VZ94_15910 [Methylocucumis oryzae]